MKTPTKAVLASMVVLALCLCTIGGVTHSWYSSSDQSEISIDTATVDVELDVIGITGHVDNIGTATVDNSNDKISISKLAANDRFNGTYNVSNIQSESSIDAIYRVYIAFDGNSITEEAQQYLKMGSSESDAVPLSQAIDIGNRKAVVIKDWTTLKIGEKDESLGFYIEADKNLSEQLTNDGSAASFSLVIEAFQSNYEIPATTVSTSNTTVSTNVPVRGDEDGAVMNTTITFDNNAATTADGKVLTISASNGTGDTGFTVADAMTIRLNLDGEGLDFNNGVVTITLRIPMGQNPGTVNVVYNGIEDQPSVTSQSYSGGILTITFTTSHFSEFVIIPGESVTVTDEEAFIAAMKAGIDVKLGADIKRTESLTDVIDSSDRYMSDAVVITGESTLDLAGHMLTNFDLHLTGSDCSLTVKDSVGNGGMTYDGFACPASDDSPTGYLISAWEGATAVVENGTFTNNIFACIYVMNGKVTVNGGTFEVISSSINDSYKPDYARFTLNLNDTSGQSGTAVIEVKGGTFYNYDPSASASENPLKDYVPEGYVVTGTTSGEDMLYTVSEEAA